MTSSLQSFNQLGPELAMGLSNIKLISLDPQEGNE